MQWGGCLARKKVNRNRGGRRAVFPSGSCDRKAGQWGLSPGSTGVISAKYLTLPEPQSPHLYRRNGHLSCLPHSVAVRTKFR